VIPKAQPVFRDDDRMTSHPLKESIGPICILNGHSIHVEEAKAHIARISGEFDVQTDVVVTHRGDDI
jgi:hypothetical protein